MPWFGEGPETEDEERASSQRKAGYTGWLDGKGHPIATRTDPKDGQALGFETRGFSGRGTPDETRARGLFGGKKKRG
jgi:hypothetical protein